MNDPAAPPESGFDLFAEGLGARLRDILMAQARWDGFVRDPEGARPETTMDGPAPTPEEVQRVASEMVLRALRVGVDPVNHAILLRLARGQAVSLAALIEHTDLPRLPLAERVNDLAQVGLASYAADTGEVRATAATTGLVWLLDEAGGRLAQILGERWAESTRT